jgi:TolB-like protein
VRFIVVVVLLAAMGAAAQGKSKKSKLTEPEPAPAPALAPTVEPPAPTAPAPAVEPTSPPAPKLSVSADAKPRLAVTALEAQGVTPAQAAAVTDAVVAALSERGLFDVVSARDLATALSAERQKQLLGVCESNADACNSSLGEVLSAPFIVSGQLSRIGTAFQLTLQTFDAVKGRPAGRSNRVASSLEALQQVIPYAAAEATGSPLPPPPSRVVPVTLLSVGAVSFISGAVFGVITLTQERLLNDELCPGGVPEDGRCTGTALSERAFYLTQNEALVRQKWVSAGLMAAGAALTVLGIVLMPPFETPGRVSLRVMPTLGGFAVTGGF